MSPDGLEPNDYYRLWLEGNIGRQGKEWDWGWVYLSDTDKVKIIFKNSSDAVLFELVWL